MKMKIRQLKFFLPLVLPSTLHACQVTLNGEDKTSDFFVIDGDNGEAYVDCRGHSKCRGAVIKDCPIVKCVDNEACNGAQIINFTESVLCEGLHACHRTEIISSDLAPAANRKRTVSCVGSISCDVAHISGGILDEVKCSGVKACRKVHVEGSKIVKCHDGKEGVPACEDFATFEVECLYCGNNGCAEYVNMCRYRYKNVGDINSEIDTYESCQPEQLMGNCPNELEAELRDELSGKEEVDLDTVEDGSRRFKRLRG